MTLYRDRYRVESARLKNWDYASSGWYFVTICTRDRECLLGEIIEGKMILSAMGEIAEQYWRDIPRHFENIKMDTYMIMPNHLHGIVNIENGGISNRAVCRDVACNVSTKSNDHLMSKMSPARGSLSAVIRSYKSAVTRRCRKNGHRYSVWQPRFYDHIIRNDVSLDTLREYIMSNPLKWDLDKNNPMNLYI